MGITGYYRFTRFLFQPSQVIMTGFQQGLGADRTGILTHDLLQGNVDLFPIRAFFPAHDFSQKAAFGFDQLLGLG